MKLEIGTHFYRELNRGVERNAINFIATICGDNELALCLDNVYLALPYYVVTVTKEVAYIRNDDADADTEIPLNCLPAEVLLDIAEHLQRGERYYEIVTQDNNEMLNNSINP